MKPIRAVLALALVAASLAACASEADNQSDPAPAQATAVSWPQPENGKLTPALCDLLTVADFQKFGELTTPWSERKAAPEFGPNAVSCTSSDGNSLLLSLQPDIVSAGLFYRAELNRHRSAMASRKKKSELQQDGIVSAGESWFDLDELSSDAYPEYDLSARRNALVVGLHLAARADSAGAGDEARTALANLVGLVFERAPAVGKEGTGSPHRMTLTVRGNTTGPVDIAYFDPVLGRQRKASGVRLPWLQEVDFGWFGSRQILISLSAIPRHPTFTTRLSCAVTVDDKPVSTDDQSSFALCSGNFTESGEAVGQ